MAVMEDENTIEPLPRARFAPAYSHTISNALLARLGVRGDVVMSSLIQERSLNSDYTQETFMQLLARQEMDSCAEPEALTHPAIVLASCAMPRVQRFLAGQSSLPYLFIAGSATDSLQHIPSESIDTVITSPPYWKQREYADSDCIGGEPTIRAYVDALLIIFAHIHRVLKPTGSFWLNLGDTYQDKNLSAIPWRVAIALQDEQGWLLRNDVVWNKLKGAPDNSKDKLRNVHEFVFHFVKQKSYYYDDMAVRHQPRLPTIKDGKVITATGVSGINYKRQIQRSTTLSDDEKGHALRALDDTLQKIAKGELHDFRMIIRGQQRTTHSDSTKVSGRASEIAKKGFCILPYDKKGAKLADVWEIIPEDEWRTDAHFAPFPEDLCVIPIEATCPPDGVVLDPFVGTGTAIVAAIKRGRKGIGLDLTAAYLETAVARLAIWY